MMAKILLPICLLVVFMAGLSVDQADAQKRATRQYSYEQAWKHRCLLSNRGRQKAITRCQTYFGIRNCSRLNEHMDCFIKSKKRVCEIEGDDLLDEAFRNRIINKYIRGRGPCGEYLKTMLRKYECRDCTKDSPELMLRGDVEKITTTQVNVEDNCIELDVFCEPESDFWISRLTVKTNASSRDRLSPQHGEPAVARIQCNLAPREWTYLKEPVKSVRCQPQAIARGPLEDGCGQCDLKKMPIKMLGDIMRVISSHTDEGCVKVTIDCDESRTDFFSELTYNRHVVSSTKDVERATIVLTCSSAQDRWFLLSSNDSEAITVIKCVGKAKAKRVLDIPCGRCTPLDPALNLSGDLLNPNGHITFKPTRKGCKKMIVRCSPRNKEWISTMEITEEELGNISTKTLNSTALGKSIEMNVSCSINATTWMDGNNKNITRIKCTDNAYVADFLHDGISSPFFLKHMTQPFVPTDGCRRLKFECTPPPNFNATWQVNDDETTNVTSLSGQRATQTLICVGNGKTHEWRIKGSTTYTQPAKNITCITTYAKTTPLSYGCGKCQKGNNGWIDSILDPKPVTSKGCLVLSVKCTCLPHFPCEIIFNEDLTVSSGSLSYASWDVTCNYNISYPSPSHINWVYQNRHDELVAIESIRCKKNASLPTARCTNCTRAHPFIDLRGVEVIGGYTHSCRALKLICNPESPAWKCSMTINGNHTTVSKQLITIWVMCDPLGIKWGNPSKKMAEVRSVVCNQRAEPV